MTASSLPPPPPPPPRPTPTQARRPSAWKEPDRPPIAAFSPKASWGLGDALTSFGIFLVSSVALVAVAILVDADPLAGFWFPLLLAGPQLTQGAFTVGVARVKGSGLDRDLGFRFRTIDGLLGIAILILGFLAAGATGALMEQLGVETPDATVAELIDDAAESDANNATGQDTEALDEAGSPEHDSGITDDEQDGRITVWIVMVAVFAATAVPIIEELIYRGLWWSALLKRGVSEGWTLVITSLAFAAAHFELERFPVLFVLGIALGVGRSLTGRIGASIIAHALINGIAMAVLLATI